MSRPTSLMTSEFLWGLTVRSWCDPQLLDLTSNDWGAAQIRQLLFLYIICLKQPNLSKSSTKKENTKIRLLFLSVSLRGLWFLSQRRPLQVSQRLNSFRPLTGIMVLIDVVNLIQSFVAQKEFPSPYGDYGSYHGKLKIKKTLGYNAFPSPYGDYGSYRWRIKHVSLCLYQSFRPLTGIMVLIRTPYKWAS